MNAPDFWNFQEPAQKVIKDMKGQRAAIEPFLAVEKSLEDAEAMYQLGTEAADPASIDEADEMVKAVERNYEKVELHALFTGPHDIADCYVQIHSGAGGTGDCA